MQGNWIFFFNQAGIKDKKKPDNSPAKSWGMAQS
jgi:hypothetical protein